MIESATFWQNGPEIETGEMRTARHRHRGVLPARRRAHREGRQLHQHPADAAVAPHGGRAGRRRAQRPVVHLPPGPPDPGQAGRLGRPDGPAGAGPDLGLPNPRAAARAQRRRDPGRDQRVGRRAPAAVVLRPAQGRRVHGVRLLDLLRGPGRRGEPGRPPQARLAAELGRPGLGLGLAAEPAGPVQPGLGRPRRQAVERAQGPGLVGRSGRAVDRARRRRLRCRPAAVLPAPGGRHRRGRDLRRRPVHPAGRRQGLAVRARGRGRRPAARPLRAAGVPVPQPAVRPAAQPGPGDHQAPPGTGSSRSAISPAPVCSPMWPPPTG